MGNSECGMMARAARYHRLEEAAMGPTIIEPKLGPKAGRVVVSITAENVEDRERAERVAAIAAEEGA